MKNVYLLASLALLFIYSSCEKETNDGVNNLTIRSYIDNKEINSLKVTLSAVSNNTSKYTWSYSNPDETKKVTFDTINGYKVEATFDDATEDYTIHCKAEGNVDSKTADLEDIWNVRKKKPEEEFIIYGDSFKNGVYKTTKFSPNSMFSESYLWDFGDGNTSTKEKPTNKYADRTDITYTVTCEITGKVDAITSTIYVVYK